jgi:hypothetical protein
MSHDTITGTDMDWQGALDKRLVDRTTRPLRKQGVISNALSRSILSRYRPMLQMHPILSRTLQRLRFAESTGIKKVPIIYRVQRTPIDGADNAGSLSEGISDAETGAVQRALSSENPGIKKSAGDGNIETNAGIAVQKKGSQSKPENLNTGNTKNLQTDGLEKKLNPGIAGTKVSDTVVNRTKNSLLRSPISSKIVQSQINRASGVKPAWNIPVIYTKASISGNKSDPQKPGRADNFIDSSKVTRQQSSEPLGRSTALHQPSNSILRKKEIGPEYLIGTKDVSNQNYQILEGGNHRSVEEPERSSANQTANPTSIRKDRIGSEVSVPDPPGKKAVHPGNDVVLTKPKDISHMESNVYSANDITWFTDEKLSYPFRKTSRTDSFPATPSGNNASSFKTGHMAPANNEFSAAVVQTAGAKTNGNNILSRQIDRRVIWRKSADFSRNDGIDRETTNRGIQRDGGNGAVVRRTTVGNAEATSGGLESDPLNDRVPPLAGPNGGIDLNKIAEKVGKILYKKLVIERERRGFGRWA